MTAKDWFGLIVRVCGLIGLLIGIWYFLSFLYVFIGSDLQPGVPASTYAIYGVILMAISLYFLRGAPGLMRFSYPEHTSQTPTDTQSFEE